MAKALKKPVNTSKLRKLNESKGKGWSRCEYFERKWQTDEAEFETTIDEYIDYNSDGSVAKREQYRSKREKRKFLCIGGKFEGTKQANPGSKYYGFNVGDFNRSDKNGGNPRKAEIEHRSVWIHISLLKAPAVAVKRKKTRLTDADLRLLASSVRHSIMDEDEPDDAD